MTQGEVIGLVVALVLVALALWLALLLLRANRPSLRKVFSRDRGVLRRRALVGLADIAYAVFVAFFFFSGELGVPVVQVVLALACLILFVTGLALWLLAGLQFFGLLFIKPKETPAELPPQSSP
jgi:uncharacterized BrkB/YihY/UPF0761 family membrane protein